MWGLRSGREALTGRTPRHADILRCASGCTSSETVRSLGPRCIQTVGSGVRTDEPVAAADPRQRGCSPPFGILCCPFHHARGVLGVCLNRLEKSMSQRGHRSGAGSGFQRSNVKCPGIEGLPRVVMDQQSNITPDTHFLVAA